MTVLLVLVALALVGLAQLWSIVAVAGVVGILWTAVLMVGCVMVGLWLVARQGASVARRAQQDLAQGRSPNRAATDGLLVLLAGLFLLVPGFVTAAIGFVLVLPPTRALVRPLVERWWARRIERGAAVFRSGAVGGAPFGGTTAFRTVIIGDVRPPGGFAGPGGFGGPVGNATRGPVDGEPGIVEAEIVDVQVDRPRELPPGT